MCVHLRMGLGSCWSGKGSARTDIPGIFCGMSCDCKLFVAWDYGTVPGVPGEGTYPGDVPGVSRGNYPRHSSRISRRRLSKATGVDLAKILSGQTKIWGREKGDKCMCVSQLLGARARAAPQSLQLCPRQSSRIAWRRLFKAEFKYCMVNVVLQCTTWKWARAQWGPKITRNASIKSWTGTSFRSLD